MELYEELKDKMQLLDKATAELKTRGSAYAQKERDYKVALAKKIIELRLDNQPVTIVKELAYGDEQVANLRYERDISESLYKSCLESINSFKLQIKIIQENINIDFTNQRRI